MSRDHRSEERGPSEARPVTRRAFLQLAGAAAAAGSSGCFQMPPESALPATQPVEGRTPGRPQSFATAWSYQGAGIGLHVQSWEGRPTKVEGNPLHPASLGATGVFEQALILQFYDAQRPTQVLNGGDPTDLRGYLAAQVERAKQLERLQGQGLRLLVRPSASPSVVRLRRIIHDRYPKSRQYAWDALSRQNEYRGAALAFGRPLESLPHFSEARVVVFLDADPLGSGPWRLAAARDLVRAREPGPTMVRLYSAEPTPTVTGMYADHRVSVRASEIGRFARALARDLAASGVSKLSWAKELQDWPERAHWLHAMAQDLARAADRGLVLAGPRAPAEIVALTHAMNDALGSASRLGRFLEPTIDGLESGPDGLRELVGELASGSVDTLIVTAFDPVYAAPSDIDLARALAKVSNSIYWAGSAYDETTRHVRWMVPASSTLESWGDERALDGTASLTQPLIAPLFVGGTELDVLAPFAGEAQRTPHDMVFESWREQRPSPDFASQFDRWLQQGVIPDTVQPNAQAAVDHARVRDAVRAQAQKEGRPAGLEVHFFESPATLDGRFAQNPWLLEFPDPATSQVWGNAARLSASTAQRLGVATGEKVALTVRGRSVVLPAIVVPGQADETVSVALGWGRPAPEPTQGTVQVGANAAVLRTTSEFWHRAGLAVERVGGPVTFATVQPHMREEGRPIAFSMSWRDAQREGAALLHEHKGPVEKLYDPFGYVDVEYKWAMAIDLNRCIGCGACVVACYAENNIPVVGLDDCRRGRDMRWLRVDRYLQGGAGSPEYVHMPLMCVHCEAAPCEYVCPVFATVHSSEGLNQMVYNRCVGTRFCSNNCPYKVRRFNWRGYTRHYGPLKRAAMNPDVSVRAQGVIEKCTYCVQRIERARIDARISGKGIDTSKLQTACQQACPTRTILFGSLHEKDSEVARLHRDPRHYFLLHDRGTRPRTTHLARIRNPHEEA